jgi:cytochrome P450
VREAGAPVPQIDPATGERFWILARYQDVLDGLRHPGIGHEVHRHRPGEGERRPASEVERIGARQLIDLDPPDHTRLRKLVSTAFTPRTVARLESRVATIVDGLIAAARRREVIDAVADLGEPMPVAVIADLIGVPQADRRRFRAWSATIMSGPAGDRDDATLEFAAYIDELAARRRSHPEHDLLSGLVALELDRDELVAMIQLLLIAGQETSVYLIVNGLRALLTHREQWDALCADPSLAAAAVEEIARFDGPVELAPPRYTFTDVRLGGATIPAFEKVGLSLLGANRDPDAFRDPDVFDIRRADGGRHLAFGHGIHFCLGAGLGRLEGRVMFARLAEQLPTLRLAEDPRAGGWIEPHVGELALTV